MTDNNVTCPVGSRRGWLFYDGTCSLCISLARRFAPILARLHFSTAPLQSPIAHKALGISSDSPVTEMRVVVQSGQTAGGADAILLLARETIWGWPLVLISCFPGIRPLLRAIYRQIAARRHCLSGACSIDSETSPATTRAMEQRLLPAQFAGRWLPLTFLVSAALFLHAHLVDWAFMWTLAGAVFMGFKWATLHKNANHPLRPHRSIWLRGLAYLFLWPGMDFRPFFAIKDSRCDARPGSGVLGAILKIIAGTVLIVSSAEATAHNPLIRGWIGMLGIILFLHFGFFDLLAVIFRRCGIPVVSIMRHPLAATSLSDFWGRRWNTAFSQLSRDLFLGGLKRLIGTHGAMFGIFLVSGLLHELVISLPALGGYGLPTAYFILQGLAVLAERSQVGRFLGLGSGDLRARLFAVLVAAGPAFFLFHPPFIHRVILPMLDAIGSLLSLL